MRNRRARKEERKLREHLSEAKREGPRETGATEKKNKEVTLKVGGGRMRSFQKLSHVFIPVVARLL